MLANGLGRPIEFVELTQDEVVAGWKAAGFSESDLEFFLRMRTNLPEAGYTVIMTVIMKAKRRIQPLRLHDHDHDHPVRAVARA